MRSTFYPEDVELLLKDITGLVEPLPASVRERRIQSGVHYCEMLPLEYRPSERYMAAYRNALRNYAPLTAASVVSLAEQLYRRKGPNLTLVSLARAGTPVGILLKRCLDARHPDASIRHYSISIIRGRGIDRNALRYILSRREPASVQFVDGWIGKGAILSELERELQAFPQLDPTLGVLSDPAGLTDLCGTHEDFLIPSSCLNATVTGLISRTFYREDLIGPHDFHGAAFFAGLRDDDLTNRYLAAIEAHFESANGAPPPPGGGPLGPQVVRRIADTCGVEDVNFIKPGIGEATRVLLRRVPWKILLAPRYQDSPELDHIKQLAREKGVDVETCGEDLGHYKVCGIIRRLPDV